LDGIIELVGTLVGLAVGLTEGILVGVALGEALGCADTVGAIEREGLEDGIADKVGADVFHLLFLLFFK
jgi:hypothetical protein